ncbi:hypothetical protein KIW84_024304 [Lathyrus oleraceus]|uniref:Retrotransposon gag domain-containing protein n=1 Tax=Pisum sativum TaxID=3888 RepID=A0A9D4YL64_PEA|nr:hypothetical protein KIW84_024304 [Pisum sativum]
MILSAAEVYFRVQDTSPELKVNLAQLCMEGSTIRFFKALLDAEMDLIWKTFKGALLERPGSQLENGESDDTHAFHESNTCSRKGCAGEAFDGKLLGSRGFGGWSSQTKWNGPSGFGLKDVGWNKTNVWVVVKGARDEPDKEETINNPKFEVRPERRQSGQREKGIQRLTSQEIADRKQKGLCFQCNGNCHHPRHQCPDRQLRIMLTKEDEDEEG